MDVCIDEAICSLKFLNNACLDVSLLNAPVIEGYLGLLNVDLW